MMPEKGTSRIYGVDRHATGRRETVVGYVASFFPTSLDERRRAVRRVEYGDCIRICDRANRETRRVVHRHRLRQPAGNGELNRGEFTVQTGVRERVGGACRRRWNRNLADPRTRVGEFRRVVQPIDCPYVVACAIELDPYTMLLVSCEYRHCAIQLYGVWSINSLSRPCVPQNARTVETCTAVASDPQQVPG